MSAGRAALEAATDQALAFLAEKRAEYGEADPLPLAGRKVAGRLRVQFPGRARENARVLAAASLVLNDLAEFLGGYGAPPEVVRDAVLLVLGFAAGDLDQGDAVGD